MNGVVVTVDYACSTRVGLYGRYTSIINTQVVAVASTLYRNGFVRPINSSIALIISVAVSESETTAAQDSLLAQMAASTRQNKRT